MSQPPSKGDVAGAKAQSITDRVMNFLSTASNETLGACVVGLGAVTYFALGKVGLVLIGAVGGVVLHATWENQLHGTPEETSTETKRRKEIGLDVVRRLLDFQDRNNAAKQLEGQEDPRTETELALASGQPLNFDDFPPETRAALNEIVDAVIRDYVKWWYSPLLPADAQFPSACEHMLVGFLLSVSNHVSRKRPADTFLNFLTNSSSMIIVFLSELSRALMAPGMYDRDVAEAIKIYLEENPDSNLANLLNREQQEKKFNLVAHDVIQTFLDSKAYNCEPVRVFLQKTLADLIMLPTLKTCSQAPWINEWIAYLLEEGEPEIMNAIDAGVGTATGKAVSKIQAQPEAVDEIEKSESQNRASKGEDAMEEAMAEVKRLNEMIAEEEARKQRERDGTDSGSQKSAGQVATPTSSQSERHSHEAEAPHIAQEHVDVPQEEAAAEPVPFTSFDQFVPPAMPSPDPSAEIQPLTLHHASVTLIDDEKLGERGTIRSKPTIEYLLQIEPASSHHSGWMAARKYPDFETLHEFTSRVAKISGITAFSQAHPAAPSWKGKTKAALRHELEVYLKDALSHEGLAESEGMKRFLEKEQALGRPTPSKGVLGFPTPETFQTMGKGMLDVMSAAPKGIAGGGQAMIKGVSGVFGAQKRQSSSSRPRDIARTDSGGVERPSLDRPSLDVGSARDSTSSLPSRYSQDRLHEMSDSPSERPQAPALPRRPSSSATGDSNSNSLGIFTEGVEPNFDSQSSSVVDVSRPESQLAGSDMVSSIEAEAALNLPPPPSEITDDYVAAASESRGRDRRDTATTSSSITAATASTTTAPTAPTTATAPATTSPTLSTPPPLQATSTSASTSATAPGAIPDPSPTGAPTTSTTTSTSTSAAPAPLTEPEAQVAVELFFAIVNELYTLSSAWNIRRTLLNTARAFLLRPGNAALGSVRTLLQDGVIGAYSTDGGMAELLRKTRANSLPTEDELAAWPPPPDVAERERLRVAARRVLLARGMPPALSSVMGAAATGEALARVFDALQEEDVARGLMFALMLQGARAVTH